MITQLPREQFSILDHTINRASNGLYCGDSPDMQALVTAGLMKFAGRAAFVPDPYFRITADGRDVWRANKPEPAPAPKLTARRRRARNRYDSYLRSDCELSFGEWLKAGYWKDC